MRAPLPGLLQNLLQREATPEETAIQVSLQARANIETIGNRDARNDPECDVCHGHMGYAKGREIEAFTSPPYDLGGGERACLDVADEPFHRAGWRTSAASMYHKRVGLHKICTVALDA